MQALAGLVEIPAIALAIFIIMKVGKKWIFCATFFCAGVACLCVAVTDSSREDLQWLKITLLMIGTKQCFLYFLYTRLYNHVHLILGKFTISAGNTIMPVYTAELYPTAIRNAGVGACNIAAGLALICVPYLSMLVSTFVLIKFIVTFQNDSFILLLFKLS